MLPKNWNAFLRNSDNKTELFLFLASKLAGLDPGEKQVFTTSGESVFTAHDGDNQSLAGLQPCNNEEADTRQIKFIC